MNFKKNKDVKRSSYYVWFLGAKESKGLRGDEYVTPVLSYLIDNECEFEPSKVTLQVSNKGLKIIQILTVPRKSSKLSADQQTQLFANSRRSIAEPPSSSVLKTEQVKHHIPHNSITWIYQEDDVICAILLLYNPITRCPVHVHAYRCDSIETADNLRQQLQTLVDKPENQKKFREIESRLAAKGLLLPPHSYNYLEDEMAPTNRQSYPTRQSNAHPFNSPTNSKTLNSDGRSTRTEGSDENSEESNSSDLGYGIRSIKNNNHDPRNEFKRIPAPPPMHSLNDMKKSFAINDPSPLDLFTPKNKSSNKSKPKKVPPEEAEIPVGVTAALYDSLAAELRAKLGNPKMGPILLPPRDYESTAGRLASAKSNDKKNSNAKDKSCVLTRSESSGKSSSGIGSDEALSTENKKSSSQYYRRFESDRHQPQSFIDIDQHKRTNRFLYPHHDNEKEKKLYSLQVYSSDEDNFGSADALDTEDIEENVIFSTSAASKSKSTFDLPSYQPPHQSSHRSSSNQPLPGQKYRRHHQPAPTDTSYVDRKVKDSQMSKLYASHPNLVRAPPAHQIPDSKENNSNNHKSSFVIGRREQRSMQQINQHNNSNGANHKMDRLHTASSKEMPLSSMSSHNVNKASHKSNGKPITSGSSQPSSKPIQKFYFADAEFCDPRKSSPLRSSQPKISHNQQSSNYRSNGNLHNLDYGSNGPTSLNYHHVNRRESQPPPPQQRSISPYFYSHQDNFDIKPKSSPPKHYSPSHQTPKQHKNQSVNHKKSSASSAINARTSYDDRVYGESHHPMPAMRSKFKDQPYSRYSYIDVDHHSNETRMGFFKR